MYKWCYRHKQCKVSANIPAFRSPTPSCLQHLTDHHSYQILSPSLELQPEIIRCREFVSKCIQNAMRINEFHYHISRIRTRIFSTQINHQASHNNKDCFYEEQQYSTNGAGNAKIAILKQLHQNLTIEVVCIKPGRSDYKSYTIYFQLDQGQYT